jgi:hypothetical protein
MSSSTSNSILMARKAAPADLCRFFSSVPFVRSDRLPRRVRIQTPSHRSMPRFCQYRKCDFSRLYDAISQQKADAPCPDPRSPPSLLGRFGSLKPPCWSRREAGSKYLIWIVLLTSICGSGSIFSCFQGAAGVRRCGDLRLIAARGSRAVSGQSRRPVRRLPVQALRRSPREEARSRMAGAAAPFSANPTASGAPLFVSITGTPRRAVGVFAKGSGHDVEKVGDARRCAGGRRGVVCSGHCRR